ncbi:MarR family winged helix-turn-helix transcriptional regulator [Dankookia rubra]|nr:MarR family winged helix-turn-helix transcriptional regulator [Dankookia rubra]
MAGGSGILAAASPGHAMTTAADFALEEFLPYRLSVVTNHTSRLFARRYSDAYGLSIPEWRVLAVVGRFGGLSATGVVERTAMDKVKVSRAVRALLDRGLLARQEDAADRRVQRLAMTAAGRALHAAIVPEARALEAGLLEALAPAERQALHALLDRLEAKLLAMGAAAGDAGPD